MNGLEHIAEVFSQKKAQGCPALMPYFTLGFPQRDASLQVIEAIATAGADLIELGIPFSDPLADGPSIQHSAQAALENGITVRGCLEMVQILRRRGISQPLLLMGYYNPVLNYGPEKFIVDASRAGADGLIIPDLPLEEAGVIEAACREAGLALAYLVAPTTPDDRLAQITGRSSGFVYAVSLVGVTGARSQVSKSLPDFLQRIRQKTDQPIAVGFGISTPEQAAQIGKMAEGVIVGSALIDTAGKAANPAQAAGEFISAISKALAGG
jgi:tryptophan synthase alpha chain